MTTTPRRMTRQQAAVAELLEKCNDFTSAQTVHARLRDAGEGVGLATVYRALQAMVEAGTVDVLRTDEGEAVYRACSTHHHHHLVCRECGRTVEVEGPAVEQWTDRVAAQHGFSDVTHTLEIFGTCDDCGRPGAS
ncbi:Fur family transcriptional regulator [Intrasporangium calvum]|uniref:Zinc uptake regulator, Fur family n=1 Tax=Intrasporangium calvum (strain ATCC 23552 / DSM 43043 / JCM 3097 / NBRC 12989 / NCIMB 10167 / NRRL B-3866 / 7 KIP) TaxID=710696 RepID=E6SDI2_INTC7|nr:zinc uptake regulator, Fur family [Intrasporangium calvum DSM 43043]AXG13634.1 transcriptional repressor [Intrasporangium calvum]